MDYILKISSAGCNCDIRVNDIPVYCVDDGLQSSIVLPVNHLLNGKMNNVLSFDAVPLSNMTSFYDGSKIFLQLLSRRNDSEKEEVHLEYLSGELSHKPAERNTFNLNLSNENILMLESASTIKVDLQLTKKLVDKYRQIEQLLINRDINSIVEMLVSREREFAKCYNLPEFKRVNYMKEYLNSLFASNAEVWRFDVNHVKPALYSFGKLIALEYKNQQSAIAVYDQKKDLTNYIDFYFGYKQGELEVLK